MDLGLLCFGSIGTDEILRLQNDIKQIKNHHIYSTLIYLYCDITRCLFWWTRNPLGNSPAGCRTYLTWNLSNNVLQTFSCICLNSKVLRLTKDFKTYCPEKIVPINVSIYLDLCISFTMFGSLTLFALVLMLWFLNQIGQNGILFVTKNLYHSLKSAKWFIMSK